MLTSPCLCTRRSRLVLTIVLDDLNDLKFEFEITIKSLIKN